MTDRLFRGTPPGKGKRVRYVKESASARQHRLERQRKYRARTKARRREYFKAYYKLNKPRYHRKNDCPVCGQPKTLTAKRCRPCAFKVARNRRIQTPRKLHHNCPYCKTEMRSMTWHGTDFYRCGSCGLETTPSEISRFHNEEAIAA